jgi:hypothetical protein
MTLLNKQMQVKTKSLLKAHRAEKRKAFNFYAFTKNLDKLITGASKTFSLVVTVKGCNGYVGTSSADFNQTPPAPVLSYKAHLISV